MAAVAKQIIPYGVKSVKPQVSPNRIQGNFKNTPGMKDIKVSKVRKRHKDTDAIIRDLSKYYGGKRRSSKKARKSRRRNKRRRSK